MFKVLDILSNPLVVMWIKGENFNLTCIKRTKVEKEWGNRMLKRYFGYTENTKQWTTCLGENIVKALLERKGYTVQRPIGLSGFKPDFETEDFIVEVKSRSWCTIGTAGEKILGVPYKYASVPKLYGKPLKIVLVAFQEYEAIHNFKLFDCECDVRKEQLALWSRQQIQFVKCTDLL